MPELVDQTMARVPSLACVREKFSSHPGQAQRLIQLAECEQTGVAGDMGSLELDLHCGAETDPKCLLASFTHRVLPAIDRFPL